MAVEEVVEGVVLGQKEEEEEEEQEEEDQQQQLRRARRCWRFPLSCRRLSTSILTLTRPCTPWCRPRPGHTCSGKPFTSPSTFACLN